MTGLMRRWFKRLRILLSRSKSKGRDDFVYSTTFRLPKENRRFLGLPLNTKEIIDHTELCHFRRDLKFSQLVNILVYILHHFYGSGLLENSVLHGVDSTEIANDNQYPLYSIKVGDKKVRVYSDIDCDCGTRRNKCDKPPYVIGYRMHTLTAINPSTGLSYPLVSLLGPANHHDSLYLKPLVELAQAMGIVPGFVSLLLITAISRECRLTAKQHDRPLRCEKTAKDLLIS